MHYPFTLTILCTVCIQGVWLNALLCIEKMWNGIFQPETEFKIFENGIFTFLKRKIIGSKLYLNSSSTFVAHGSVVWVGANTSVDAITYEVFVGTLTFVLAALTEELGYTSCKEITKVTWLQKPTQTCLFHHALDACPHTELVDIHLPIEDSIQEVVVWGAGGRGFNSHPSHQIPAESQTLGKHWACSARHTSV